MFFNIEKGIKPAQVSSQKTDKYDKLPLSQMVKGDSIFVPTEYATSGGIGAFLVKYRKATNEDFTLRKAEGGTRVFKLS